MPWQFNSIIQWSQNNPETHSEHRFNARCCQDPVCCLTASPCLHRSTSKSTESSMAAFFLKTRTREHCSVSAFLQSNCMRPHSDVEEDDTWFCSLVWQCVIQDGSDVCKKRAGESGDTGEVPHSHPRHRSRSPCPWRPRWVTRSFLAGLKPDDRYCGTLMHLFSVKTSHCNSKSKYLQRLA